MHARGALHGRAAPRPSARESRRSETYPCATIPALQDQVAGQLRNDTQQQTTMAKAEATKQGTDGEGSSRVVKSLTESIVFLTKAKRELFPDSVIQARGYLGGASGPVTMEKRLIWLSADGDDQQAAEISEGAEITAMWLQIVSAQRPMSVDVLIAGDDGPIAGMIVDEDNPTNWVLHLEFLTDGTVSATFFNVPPEVRLSMSTHLRR